MSDVKIKDAPLVDELTDSIKIPASDGTNTPKAVSVEQLHQEGRDLIGYDTFSTSKAYSIGDIVFYEGNLYKFTVAHAAGAWDSEDVEVTSMKSQVTELAQEVSTKAEKADVDASVTDLEDRKANKDGYYTELTCGMSEQLLSPDGVVDEVPYLYRTTAGDASVSSGVAEIQTLKGNSLVWNQLAKVGNSKTEQGLTFTKIDDYTVRIQGTPTSRWPSAGTSAGKTIANHYYYTNVVLVDGTIPTGLTIGSYYASVRQAGVQDGAYIHQSTQDVSNCMFQFTFLNLTDYNDIDFTLRFTCIDLTQMYGAGNEPTSVEEFKKDFPNDYYEYNAGEIINVEPNGLKTTGFNQWDEQWELGYLYDSNGATADSTDSIRSKDYNKITPNTKYFFYRANTSWVCLYDNNKAYTRTIYNYGGFVTKSNEYYFKIGTKHSYGTTYKNDICINYYWSGYRNGEYEEYNEHNISLPIKSIKDSDGNLLFPDGLLSAGSVYDEITSTRAIKRVGIRAYQSGDESDSSVITDKTNTIYTLATPIEVDFADVPQDFGTTLNLTYFMDDFGTEEFTTDSTGLVAPVAHSTFYMTNLRDKIRTIDGNTDEGALMNDSLANLLTTLGTALGGTLTKTWNETNANWEFTFTANSNNE